MPQGSVSNAVGVGSAVTLLGPQPAVIASDTNTGQFDLNRLSEPSVVKPVVSQYDMETPPLGLSSCPVT